MFFAERKMSGEAFLQLIDTALILEINFYSTGFIFASKELKELKWLEKELLNIQLSVVEDDSLYQTATWKSQ